jgi:hypothetical protein
VSHAVSCPRCGRHLRAPGLARSDWHCEVCGTVPPLHVMRQVSQRTVATVRDRLRVADSWVPLWCPWPLPRGWTITGVGWVGDDRAAPLGSALVLSGPAPIASGPADVVLVAEEPAVGLGMSLAGVTGSDPGPYVRDAADSTAPHAKVRVAGHPTPLWAVTSLSDRSAYIGEAKGMWLCVISWPAPAGYLLAEQLSLHDLVESMPAELVFGAPSGRLFHRRSTG